MTKLSKKEIKIFCEKSKSKGNGHFIRSERLYYLLKKKGFDCSLAVNNSSKEINRKIKKAKNQFSYNGLPLISLRMGQWDFFRRI